MPPTPPVPAVTITTDPATPIDMSLATGEEQQVALHFSRSLIWSDFIEKAAFTFMYDGEIHSDVVPNTGGGGGRIDGDDGELLIDIREWSVPSSDVNITLELGHKDWVLLGITYDDRYQLKPQDLVGLKIYDSTNPNLIANQLLTGVEVPFTFNSYLITARIDSSSNNAHFKICKCNPDETSKATRYEMDFASSDGIITSYSCSTFDSSELASDLKDYLVDNIGFQPQQVTTCVFDGYLTKTPIPLGFYEL